MSIKTTIHFLVYCDLYPEMRNNLFLAISPLLEANGLSFPNDNLLVKFLHSGDETFSVEDNTTVLTAALDYIDKSIRFDLS